MSVEQLRKLDKDLGKAVDIERAKEEQGKSREFQVDLVEQAVVPVLEALTEQSTTMKQTISSLNDSLIEQSKSFDKSIQVVAEAIKAVKVNVPDVIVPDIKVPEVKVPKIAVPEVKVDISTESIEKTLSKAIKGIKAPIVNVPEAVINVDVPKMNFEWPEGDMSVRGIMELAGIDSANPLPVQLRDSKGKPVDFNFGGGSSGSRGYKSVKIENTNGVAIDLATEAKQDSLLTELEKKADVTETQPVSAASLPLPSGAATSAKQLADNHNVIQSNTLVPANYDYIALTYVAAGNGAGEVETAIYKTGGAGGSTVGTLTLAYNASDEISSITKT